MKRFSVFLFCLFFMSQLAFSSALKPSKGQGMKPSKSMQEAMWGDLANLPALLHLNAAQQAQFRLYWHDMEMQMMKEHEMGQTALRNILTPEQWNKLCNDMKNPKLHSPKNDSEMEALVEKEANALLLTANQAYQFRLISLRLFHEKLLLEKYFLSRLEKVVNNVQKIKLLSWMEKEGFKN
jgi:hypothetical protein